MILNDDQLLELWEIATTTAVEDNPEALLTDEALFTFGNLVEEWVKREIAHELKSCRVFFHLEGEPGNLGSGIDRLPTTPPGEFLTHQK